MTPWHQRWTGWQPSKVGQWFRMSEVGGYGGNWRQKILLGDNDSSFWWHGAYVRFMAGVTGGGHCTLKKIFAQTCIGGECVSGRRDVVWESVPNEDLMLQDWLWRRRKWGILGSKRSQSAMTPESWCQVFFCQALPNFFCLIEVEKRSRQTAKTKNILRYVNNFSVDPLLWVRLKRLSHSVARSRRTCTRSTHTEDVLVVIQSWYKNISHVSCLNVIWTKMVTLTISKM